MGVRLGSPALGSFGGDVGLTGVLGIGGAVAMCATCGPESKLSTVVGLVLVESCLLCRPASSPSLSGSEDVKDIAGPSEDEAECPIAGRGSGGGLGVRYDEGWLGIRSEAEAERESMEVEWVGEAVWDGGIGRTDASSSAHLPGR